LVRKKENEREFLIKKGKFQVNFEWKIKRSFKGLTQIQKKSCKTWENDFSGIISRWNLMLMIKLMRN
jgi:hypothetical protein